MKGAVVLAFLTAVQGVHRAQEHAEQVGHQAKVEQAEGKLVMEVASQKAASSAQAGVQKAMTGVQKYMQKKNAVARHRAELDAYAGVWESFAMVPTDVSTDEKVKAYGELAAQVEELKVDMEMTAQSLQKDTVETEDAEDKASLTDDKALAKDARNKETIAAEGTIVMEGYKAELAQLESAREEAKAGLDPELVSNEDGKAAKKGYARRVELAFMSMIGAEHDEREALAKAGEQQLRSDKQVATMIVVIPKEAIVDAVLEKEAGLQRECEEHKGRRLLDVGTTTLAVAEDDWVTYAGCVDSCQTDRECKKLQYDRNERKCQKYAAAPESDNIDLHRVSLNNEEGVDALVCEDWSHAKGRVVDEFKEAQAKVNTAASFIESFSEEAQDAQEGLHRFKMASLLNRAALSPAVKAWKAEFLDAKQKASEAQDRLKIQEQAQQASSLLDTQVDLSEFEAPVAEPDNLKRECRKFPDTRLASVGKQLKAPDAQTSEECFKSCFDASTCEQAMFHSVSKTCQLRTSQTLQKHEGNYAADQFISLQCRYA